MHFLSYFILFLIKLRIKWLIMNYKLFKKMNMNKCEFILIRRSGEILENYLPLFYCSNKEKGTVIVQLIDFFWGGQKFTGNIV